MTDDGDAAACRRLWVSVLVLAMKDCFQPLRGEFRVPSLQRVQARSWIGSRDFRSVCELAGVDPERMQEKIGHFIRLEDAGAMTSEQVMAELNRRAGIGQQRAAG